jgi:murein DD-endopeptidase
MTVSTKVMTRQRPQAGLCGVAAAWLLVAATACAPFRPGLPADPVAREQPPATDQGVEIASMARAQIGVPYRYGGDEPRGGFDCSGLVAYVHSQEGIVVPRTAALQYAAASKVDEDELRPGDLVFFRTTPGRREVTHVGVYTGQRRFVHAPQTGRDVTETSLDDPYYRDTFVGSGRLHDPRTGAEARLGSPP